VRYWCSSCWFGTSYIFLSEIGRFSARQSGLRSGTTISDTRLINSTVVCAQRCLSTTSCLGFNYALSQKRCRLFSSYLTSLSSSTAWIYHDRLAGNSTYVIRDGDPLAYTVDTSSTDFSVLTLTPVSYGYSASVRARNLKGWSTWSSDSPSILSTLSSLTATTWGGATTTPTLWLTWTTNYDPSATIMIEVWADVSVGWDYKVGPLWSCPSP
jgi:hypothetical protein